MAQGQLAAPGTKMVFFSPRMLVILDVKSANGCQECIFDITCGLHVSLQLPHIGESEAKAISSTSVPGKPHIKGIAQYIKLSRDERKVRPTILAIHLGRYFIEKQTTCSYDLGCELCTSIMFSYS